MGFVEENGLRYYQFDLFTEQPLFHAVLSRRGGFSKVPFDSLNTGGTVGDDPQAVLKNHEIIYQSLEFDYASRFDVWLVHGTKIVCSDAPRGLDIPHQKADGIMTNNPSVTLFMRFADCVPILLFDPLQKVVGIIHAGWQGTFRQITRHAVEKMVACYGSAPEAILAGIGPSICQDCYQVGVDVYQAFVESIGEKGRKYFKKVHHRYYLDLWQANIDQLNEAGVEQVEGSGICTACHLEDWYSHRAEGGKTGRFGVLMSLV